MSIHHSLIYHIIRSYFMLVLLIIHEVSIFLQIILISYYIFILYPYFHVFLAIFFIFFLVICFFNLEYHHNIYYTFHYIFSGLLRNLDFILFPLKHFILHFHLINLIFLIYFIQFLLLLFNLLYTLIINLLNNFHHIYLLFLTFVLIFYHLLLYLRYLDCIRVNSYYI